LLSWSGATAQEVGVAARVNGVEVSIFRLERYFEEYLKEKGRNVGAIRNPQAYKSLKREALEQLVERQLVWQEAQRRNAIAAADEVQAAIGELRARFPSQDAFARRLDEAGFTEKTYLDYLKQELSAQRYLALQIGAKLTVSDQAVHEFYAGNPDKFIRPEEIGACHILIKVDAGAGAAKRAQARQRIGEILAEARKGADFAALAKKYSEDVTAASGGDLGHFSRGRMVKAFEDAAFALKLGEISDVVETPFGYHIIKLETRTSAGLVPEAEVAERVRQYLLTGKRRRAAEEVIEELRSKAKIEILLPL
jgi:parvulin-like peptidyl-prolyl isomerase